MTGAVTVPVALRVNGKARALDLDTRTSLLDALRDHLGLTGSKKGCNHGQCEACTVLLDGRRVNACLVLAVSADGVAVTTVEGLAPVPDLVDAAGLHLVQAAFLEHDAYQCGYCTPGQICSAVGALEEWRRGVASIVELHGGDSDPGLSDDEIRERMSGNLCRCGAYANIAAAASGDAKAAEP